MPRPADAQNAQKEGTEDHLTAQDERGHGWHDYPQGNVVVKMTESGVMPLRDRCHQSDQAYRREQAAGQQSALQAAGPQQPADSGVLRQESFRAGVDLGEQSEKDRLEANHDHGGRYN